MKVLADINRKKEAFSELCQTYDVKSVYAFGSSTNDTFNESSSDIDLLIEIDTENPITRGDQLIALWDKFEEFFQRKVDLLTSTSIKNPILKKNIDATKILIYDGKRKKISS